MKIAGKTDIGLVRETNQDAFKIVALGQGAGFALVCDGMGGVNGGDRASSIAKAEIAESIKKDFQDEMQEDEIRSMMLRAIDAANQTIYHAAKENPAFSGMGTTVVLTVLYHARAFVAHVGDSRLYQFKDGRLRQLTKDHSRVQDLVDNGIITQEEARIHPEKNMITRAVGIGPDVSVDFLTIDFLSSDKLLLCSDGLFNICSDEEISCIIQNNPAEKAAETLVKQANLGGGYDNITVVIVEK
ncbi:MAG: Stp1/IreP family PP2C-type Ser/Thr phosphatase [Oscillospiraceae bacterium]